jgi:hypothetical protein
VARQDASKALTSDSSRRRPHRLSLPHREKAISHCGMKWEDKGHRFPKWEEIVSHPEINSSSD